MAVVGIVGGREQTVCPVMPEPVSHVSDFFWARQRGMVHDNYGAERKQENT